LSLQKTTDDLILQIKSIGLSAGEYTQLSQALRLSDFVKFAKFNPTETDNASTFDSIKNSIEMIEKTSAPPTNGK
jgi:hypothetical protein